MANLLTHLARGEVALSVTMTAVSSLMALITVPLYLAWPSTTSAPTSTTASAWRGSWCAFS